MGSRPTFVLVPGAWHKAETWSKVTTLLEAEQYKCVSVTLPSTLANPDSTFLDDIEAVRDAIKAETTQGRDVVVVVWSYGSVPGSSAIKGFARLNEQATTDSSGHAIGLFLMATGFNIANAAFLSNFGDEPPPIWKADTETGFLELSVNPRDLFYHDLSVGDAKYWADNLTKQALKPLSEGGEYSYSGWQDVPCWYLATVEDRALPIEAQKYFVQLAKDAGADVTLREINSGHCPMLSRSRETVDIILDAVKDFTKKSGASAS